MPVGISPVANFDQYFDNDGEPLSGGKIFTYEAGSNTVEKATYSDSSETTLNPNPIVLDSSGRSPTDIWLIQGQSYNIVLTEADGTTVLESTDDVSASVSSAASTAPTLSTAIWIQTDFAPTYVSPTIFLVEGNLVQEFAVGNRVQIEYAGQQFLYGTVSAVIFSNPNTQVTIINDSTVQNSGMIAAYWSVNVTGGKTVDAGAVTYQSSLPYPTPATVGYELKAQSFSQASNANSIANELKVITTGGVGTAYTLTPSPAATSYSTNMAWKVKFHASSSGTPTLNVSNLGARNLKQYDSNGAKVTAVVQANRMSDVFYDGTDMVVQDGLQGLSNGNFTGGNQSLASSGYQIFPGGFTIQWGSGGALPGSGSSATVSFPIQFSSVFQVISVPFCSGGGGGTDGPSYAQVSGSVTTSGFTARNFDNKPVNSFAYVAYGTV